MARSRSSFELSGAIAAAASLSGETEEKPRLFEGVPLVSFGVMSAAGTRPVTPRSASASASGSPSPPPAPVAIEARARVATPASPTSEPPESIDARRPPKLPDLSGVVSPIVRCEKIVEWVEEATGATEVFLADGSGLPIAGAIGGGEAAGASSSVEARLAAAGLCASSVAQLAASLPGSGTPLFELSVGDGPYFQVIGLTANGGAYLVGLFRSSPLTVRQAHAIRLACRHALGDAMGDNAVSTKALEDDATVDAPLPPVPLDGIAYGIDCLDALLVFHLGDAHLHAAWVRADAGFRADEAVSGLRDAYRVSQFAARRLSSSTAGERRGEAQNPLLTLEVTSRTALLRRIRSYVVAVIFDATMPLGMARLVAARLAVQLEPELPREGDAEPGASSPAREAERPRAASGARATTASSDGEPTPAARAADGDEREPATVAFARSSGRASFPRVTLTELDRTRRLLMYAEAHAPESHTMRLRVALRTGLTPLALEHPETLGADAVVLIETAVEDILGIDRAELRSVV